MDKTLQIKPRETLRRTSENSWSENLWPENPRSENPWPKHHRVYLILKQEIEDGLHSENALMQGDLVLAERFGVSRITIRKAMDRLTAEGFIERQRGRGTFARNRDNRNSPVIASLSGNIDNILALALQTDVELIDLTYGEAPPHICSAMGRPAGAEMQRAMRVRSLDGMPFSHLTTWVPAEIGRSFTADEMRRSPLLQLIERSGHHIVKAQQSISAKLASPEVARLLHIEPGEPLLSIRRLVFDDKGEVVEYISGLYRPDTFEHEMEYVRSERPTAEVWTT